MDDLEPQLTNDREAAGEPDRPAEEDRVLPSDVLVDALARNQLISSLNASSVPGWLCWLARSLIGTGTHALLLPAHEYTGETRERLGELQEANFSVFTFDAARNYEAVQQAGLVIAPAQQVVGGTVEARVAARDEAVLPATFDSSGRSVRRPRTVGRPRDGGTNRDGRRPVRSDGAAAGARHDAGHWRAGYGQDTAPLPARRAELGLAASVPSPPRPRIR